MSYGLSSKKYQKKYEKNLARAAFGCYFSPVNHINRMFLSRISYKQLNINSEGRALGHYLLSVNVRHAENTTESVAAAFSAWVGTQSHPERIEYMHHKFIKKVK